MILNLITLNQERLCGRDLTVGFDFGAIGRLRLAFPQGGARERILFELIKQLAKTDPEDPEWLRYKLSIAGKAGEHAPVILTEPYPGPRRSSSR